MRVVRVGLLLAVGAILALCPALVTSTAAALAPAEVAAQRVNLLLLSSFHKDLPAQQQLEDGLDEVLGFRAGNARVFVEYLDSARLQAPPESIGTYLSEKYRDADLTLIVAYAPAAGQVLERLSTTLPAARRAYLEVESPMVERIRAADPRALILAAQHDYSPSLAESLRVTGARRLLVVGETQDVSAKVRLELFRRAVGMTAQDVKVEYLLDRPLPAVLERVDDLKPGSAVYYLLMFSDGAKPARPYDIAGRIAQRASVPVLTPWESLLGSGVLGGYLISHRMIGAELGRLAATVAPAAAGEVDGSPGAKPSVVRISGMRHAYDWRQLRKFGIDKAAVADDSVMLFEEPSVYDRYRGRILAGGFVVLGLLALSVVLWRINLDRLRALETLDHERMHLKRAVQDRTVELNERLQELGRKNEELRATKDRLARLANTDELTGLANRRQFDAALQYELSRLYRAEDVLSIAMLDVDHFKAYNDHYGHARGDSCLQEVAKLLADTARRPADTAARFGGEEFMLILPQTGHLGALAVMSQFRSDLAGIGIAHAASLVGPHVTVSIGLVTIRSRAESQEGPILPSARQLVELVDNLLYRAKAAGRDQIICTDLSKPPSA